MIQREINEGKRKQRELFAARKCREFFPKFPKFAKIRSSEKHSSAHVN